MKELEFLKEQNVSEDLIHGVEEFRKNYGVDEAVQGRVTRPSIPFYGKEILEMAIAGLLEGENLLLAGPKATGKNILAENLAYAFGRPIYNVSFHVNTNSGDLIGTDTFVNNEVCLRKGSIYQCAEYGGFGILDEINMAKNDAVSVLHATLDYRRSIDVPGYDRIDLHPAARFIGTMNYGYAGTKELNEALVSRFLVIDMPTMQAIAGTFDIATILGAQIVGGIVAVIVGIFIKQIRKFFPPLITGTVVFAIGLSLYPTAINYMAGGASNESYGSWQNWLVAIITLCIVTVLNHYGKGIWKLASILIGIIAGYIISLFFGMVDFSAVVNASWFALPKPMHFGITFEPSSCVAIGVLFAINSIQAIGDFSATTTGGLDRMPTDEELSGGIVGYGLSNIFCAVFGGLPTATYSQNVGIVGSTKVVAKRVFETSAIIILIAGLIPKFSSVLTTIPYCVLGGATVSVFASIAMTGIKLITTAPMDFRNTTVVGLSIALGMGVTQANAALATFPEWVTTIFGKSPVVLATITAVFLNLVLPKSEQS